jgi:hypothetical protein
VLDDLMLLHEALSDTVHAHCCAAVSCAVPVLGCAEWLVCCQVVSAWLQVNDAVRGAAALQLCDHHMFVAA